MHTASDMELQAPVIVKNPLVAWKVWELNHNMLTENFSSCAIINGCYIA